MERVETVMCSEYRLHCGKRDIPVAMIRSKRKTMSLEVKNGQVIMRIPLRLPQKEAIRFLQKHQGWVEEKLQKKCRNRDFPMPALEEMDKEDIVAMKQLFADRVAYFATLMCVSYGRIAIRAQKTRWGSCSGKGNLNFNYRLYFLPREWMDYVIIHELAHRVHMNHSSEFWNLVETYCPQYRTCRAGLREVELR